ncbi:hypothetical protein Btru_022520 [Bulinus truncatus]|nr:hypothetical protein Btru_022520 [Bulinus truncatus]
MTDTKVYTRILFLSESHLEQFHPDYFSKNPDNETLPFMDEMLARNRKCPYWTLLTRYCPSCLDKRKTESKRKVSLQELISNFASHENVFLFTRYILLNILPMQVLGTRKNFNRFLKRVQNLLSLQLHDSISVEYMIHGIQTSKIKWLKSLDLKLNREKLKQAIHYIIIRIISPLIRSFFHVTESERFKNRLFFFRKKTWNHMFQTAMCKFIYNSHLKKVTPEWVEEKQTSHHCLGVSQVRFLLKKSGLRTIINMSKATDKVSVNKQLKTLLRVLTFEKENAPQSFGATIMSLDDIYIKWKNFIREIRGKGVPKTYFVKVDIEKCYDSINICLLYTIVKELFLKTCYKVCKFKKLKKVNGLRKTVYLEKILADDNCRIPYGNWTFCGSYVITKDALIKKLRSLLFCQVLKLGKHHYVQTLGIPQGSLLSTILCGAYYGHLDRTMLLRIVDRGDFLIRMVDDILLVTRNKMTALDFLRIFLEGIPEFNCRINLMKCCTNFNYVHPLLGKVPSLAENANLSFCGLSFNIRTLEVFPDFSNYKNVKTRDLVSWNWTSHMGKSLKKKILSSVRPKCLCIFFDQEINSPGSICYSLICIFAVCAVKFHCLVKLLPKKKQTQSNPAFFVGILESLPQELMTFITSKMKSVNPQDKKYIFPLPLKSVRKICRATFLFQLKQHGSLYIQVIEHLNQIDQSEKLFLNIQGMLQKAFSEIHIQ